MKTRIIGSALVRELLTMEDCIAAMRQALCSVSAGNAQMLQRQMLSNRVRTNSRSWAVQTKSLGCVGQR